MIAEMGDYLPDMKLLNPLAFESGVVRQAGKWGVIRWCWRGANQAGGSGDCA